MAANVLLPFREERQALRVKEGEIERLARRKGAGVGRVADWRRYFEQFRKKKSKFEKNERTLQNWLWLEKGTAKSKEE